jgi:hypothetical protein
MTRSRIDPFTPEWSVFRKGEAVAVVPRAALLIRLRRVIGEEYFGQASLAPLKRFMNAIFIAGPLCVLLSLYLPWGEALHLPLFGETSLSLPDGGGLIVWLGILSLAVASLYWFAPHLMCRLYLTRKGFEMTGAVEAADFAAAQAKAGEAK